MIGMPVASIRAGTIRNPPPMPKNPDIAPVARPRPTIAGTFDIERAGDRRPWPRDRGDVRILRHRRRIPDRAGPDAGDRHADHERGLVLAGGGYRLRPDHGGQLCLVRS